MQIIEKTFNWATGLSKRKKTEIIILHHADADKCSIEDIHSWHLQRGWSGVGYHFLVRKDGSIYRGRPEDAVGAHTTGNNINSIGICFEGIYTKQIMPEAQIKAGQELVSYLRDKYNITKVKKHKDFMATDCPGNNFPFDRVVNRKVINNTNKENLILSFQMAAIADGFDFPKYGTDGFYGSETEDVMKICIVKKRIFYKNKNTPRLVQRLLGIKEDGLCGNNTSNAIKEFQKKNGLVSDGCVGLKTWKVLLNIK